MKSFIDIVEKLKDIVSVEFPENRVFDKDIAHILGVSQVNFASMKSRNRIPYQELLEFCASRSIAINWLLFNQSPESLIESTNRYYMIRYFKEVSASAGGGGYNSDENYENIMIEPHFIEVLGGESRVKDVEAINVSGDSMEPLFQYGDIIFIDRERKEIQRGGVFVISTEYGVFLKRLQIRVDGKIDIISDNKEYLAEVAKREEVDVIGRVIGKFGRID